MRRIIGSGLIVLIAALLAVPAFAVAGNAVQTAPVVQASGSWGSAHYVLAVAKNDTGKIESELHVTKAVNGQKWLIKMKDNGVVFFAGTRTVRQHELEAKGFATNHAGPDTIKVIGANKATGRTFTAKATF
jgi:hypothetical protein